MDTGYASGDGPAGGPRSVVAGLTFNAPTLGLPVGAGGPVGGGLGAPSPAFAPPAQPAFTFGGGAPQPQQQQAPFMFGQAAQPQASPAFTFGATPAAVPGMGGGMGGGMAGPAFGQGAGGGMPFVPPSQAANAAGMFHLGTAAGTEKRKKLKAKRP